MSVVALLLPSFLSAAADGGTAAALQPDGGASSLSSVLTSGMRLVPDLCPDERAFGVSIMENVT